MTPNYDWLKLVQDANGGPLPLATDPLAGQYGAQQQGVGGYGTKTDTGWDFMPGSAFPGPGPLYDNNGVATHTPPSAGGQQGSAATASGAGGTSPFGYQYSNPGGGFNPWGLYDGGNGYQGGDGVGLYNPAKDTAKGWGPNGQTELDRDRVWRMTLGDLKAQGLDPGSADPATVQAAFLNNVARLHRDYRDTQGLGEAAWASSPFAAYDRFLAGGSQAGGATQQGGSRGTGQTTTTAPAGQTGGTSVNPPIPPYGLGPGVGAAGQGQGSVPAAANPPAGPGLAPTYAQPPGTGAPGAYGSATGGVEQTYMNDQAYRTAQLLKALGLGDINSRMSYGGSVIARQAPGLFEAWREAQGAGGGGVQGMDQLGAFANVYNSPGALGNIAQTGQQGLNWLMGQGGQGISDPEMVPLIQAFEQLANIRQPDIMQRYFGNLTDQGLGQFLQGLDKGNITSGRLAPYLQNNPLYHFLTGQR